MNSALAQVVIPYGNFDDGFEKYLVAAITFLLLCFAVWQYFRGSASNDCHVVRNADHLAAELFPGRLAFQNQVIAAFKRDKFRAGNTRGKPASFIKRDRTHRGGNEGPGSAPAPWQQIR